MAGIAFIWQVFAVLSVLLSSHGSGSAITVHRAAGDGVFEMTIPKGFKGRKISVTQYGIDPFVEFTAKVDHGSLPMPVYWVQCVDRKRKHLPLDGRDQALGRTMFSNWCEMYDPHKGSVVVSVRGNATWYMCNFDFDYKDRKRVQHCSRKEILNASAILDEECGIDMPGYIELPDWNKHYGRGKLGQSICRKIEAAP